MSVVSRRTLLEMAGASLAASVVPIGAGAQALLPVHVGASLDEGLTPVLYALKSGIFKKNGLDVTLTPAQNGAFLATAVAGGSVDIGKSALLSLINAHLRGVNFRLVAGAVLYLAGAQSVELCVLKTGPIASLADVAGKTVAVASLQSLDQMATQALIDQHGGNSASCRFVEITPGAMLAALQAGRADVASIVLPVLQGVLEGGEVRTLGDPYDALGKRLPIAGWFCTQEYAARNPAIVKHFGTAMHEAATYTNAHHEETIPLLAAYTGLEPGVLRKMRRDTNATDLDPKDIQPAIDAAYRYKFISATFDAKDLIAS